MPTSRLYVDTKTQKLVHAKPSTQEGIIVWYYDRDGAPHGRCMASTISEFNARFKLAPRKPANEFVATQRREARPVRHNQNNHSRGELRHVAA